MKKIVSIGMVFLLLLSLTACIKTGVTVETPSDTPEETPLTLNEPDPSQTPSAIPGDAENTPSASPESEPTVNATAEPKKTETEQAKESAKADPPSINTDMLPAVHIDDTPEQSSSQDETEQLDFDVYSMPANMIDWLYDGDTVYSLHRNPNCLCVIDSNDVSKTAVYSLAGRPAELHVLDSQIMISYPDLQKIIVYDKSTMAQTEVYTFSFSVSSFCMDGDTVYATEDDQWCNLYKVSLATKDETKLTSQRYYYPKILLNKENGLLYLGESASTGSKLYYIRLSDGEIDSKYVKNNYGYENIQRSLFHVDGHVFWGSFRFSQDDATQLFYQYDGFILIVDNRYVVTTKAIYDNAEDLPLASLASPITSAIITQSENILFYDKTNSAIYVFHAT